MALVDDRLACSQLHIETAMTTIVNRRRTATAQNGHRKRRSRGRPRGHLCMARGLQVCQFSRQAAVRWFLRSFLYQSCVCAVPVRCDCCSCRAAMHPSIRTFTVWEGVEVMKAQGPAVRCSADGLLGRTSARWLAKRSNSPAP